MGLFTGNKGGHNEHFLKFSALYYFFPFQNLKFLDYTVREASGFAVARHNDAACQNQALLENIYIFFKSTI